ncbi:TetR/AcrR family transcriptional regulator [Arthrobacter sp. 24S4-2]|uniref:TetR/AcrR family transcriptional regulator n=1 Tax=Arthrobacter sp. 24S4-2 TaxID=2575374 RepID=UPI001586458D|nr:TetR/AcrR family transcriptional regulator [Arthrobacter sp. 24S4-2]
MEQKKLAGRPRDPEIRKRVLLAAQRVYVRAGFSGMTFEAVAREAAVGKPAIYRRWASAEALMDDVLSSHVLVPDRSMRGEIRPVLRAIAMSVLRLAHSEEGAFVLRVSSERALHPKLFDQYFERLRSVIHFQNRALIVEATSRGELVENCNPDILIQTITGSVLVSALMGFTVAPDKDEEGAARYCDDLVAQILRGVASDPTRR